MRRFTTFSAVGATVLATQLLATSSALALVSNGPAAEKCADVTPILRPICEALLENDSAGGSAGGNGGEIIRVAGVAPKNQCQDTSVICVPLGKDGRAPDDLDPDLDHKRRQGHGGGGGGVGRPSCKKSSGVDRERVCKPAPKQQADKEPPRDPQDILKDEVLRRKKCLSLQKLTERTERTLRRMSDAYYANPALDTREKRQRFEDEVDDLLRFDDEMKALGCAEALELT